MELCILIPGSPSKSYKKNVHVSYMQPFFLNFYLVVYRHVPFSHSNYLHSF